MKKVIVSSVLVIAIVAYVIYQHTTGQANAPVVENKNNTAPTSASSTPTTALYKDGTYTGDVADAYYGSLQVQAVITGGQITDVQFLKYPDTAGHTLELSQQVMPTLKSEAITAQSANVNIISGATQDTQAFQKSLASALALAQN